MASISSSASSSRSRATMPPDSINLRLILVSGRTKDFVFASTDSAMDIANHVYNNWPEEWQEERVSSAEILRLIYHGRFLHGNVTLAALGLPTNGKTTVMHLVPRESLPEPTHNDDEKKKSGVNRCCNCCQCCTIS